MARKPKLPAKIVSKFALLDVTRGRKALANAVDHIKDENIAVPVVITGFIVNVWGDDDGTSQEFQIDVTEVKIG